MQWSSTLEKYAYPEIGNLVVRNISLPHITKILEPIWKLIPETASRLRGRIESILSWATVRGFRHGENPARWKGNLDHLLPARNKVAKVKHHSAMDWKDASTFMQKLIANNCISSKALQFVVLSACRSGEVRSAQWNEFDLKHGVWTVPAEKMKAGKEHRVPLSQKAMDLIKTLPYGSGDDYLFSNSNGKKLSDAALLELVKGMGYKCTVHGFRSTYRDWAGETTNFPREVIEHGLAHKLKDKAEAAYARGDLFTKRTKLMNAWAEYLYRPVNDTNNVTSIKGAA